MDKIKVVAAARASKLSRAQFEEIQELLPHVEFQSQFLETTGDIDLVTSLRSLDKTDFFTKELDQLLLKGGCRVAFHSAKDLPEPLPDGISVIALTRGKDPGDSLVLKEGETLESLPKGALIATSSERREVAVRALRKDLSFCDIRGTIDARLKQLEEGKVHGVVIAEAALIRLKLEKLNRIRLPGSTTTFQGQLAVTALTGDKEMAELFRPLDVRRFPKALYFGPELPLHQFQDRWLFHCPLTRVVPLPAIGLDEAFRRSSHLIITSKTAARIMQKRFGDKLFEKEIVAVGSATASLLQTTHFPKEETQEGLFDLLASHHLSEAELLYPHSLLARPFLRNALIREGLTVNAIPLYTLEKDPLTDLPDLSSFQELLFSSPSSVEVFFSLKPSLSPNLRLTAIGPITKSALERYRYS